ncbi:MAG: PAS domain S-box protein [Alphaproteobacteria bacterium]|nr:PAS domain S-box protein [Alphaproteobacteria bacterium]
MATRSARTLSRHYAKLAAISSIPLVVLIVALGYVHYSEQRHRRLDNLMVSVNERHQRVEMALSAMAEHASQMQNWAEYYLARPDQRLSRLLPLLTVESDPRSQDITGYFLDDNVFGALPEATGNFLGNSLALAGGSDTLSAASLSLEIFPIQQLGHVANPALLYSYFYDGRGNFLSIYPASDRYDYEVLADDKGIAASVRHFFKRPVFLQGTPELNPDRKAYWVNEDRDGVRGRAVVSRAAPVYGEGDRFVGVVGVDVLQSHFGTLLEVKGLNGVAARVVDGNDTIIAYLGRIGQPGYHAIGKHIQDVVPGNGAFSEAGGWYLLRLPLHEAGWHLDYAIPVSEVHAGLAWRFLPYGLILCGLIATLVLGQVLVRMQFVRPVLAFAQYLRDGAGGRPVPPPELPRVWKPMTSILSATFKRNRESLERLRASDHRYRRLVELSPDAVMLHDHEKITFLNPAGCRILGFTAPEQAIGRSYMDFIAEREKEAAQERVDAVIKHGRDILPTERVIRTDSGRERDIEGMATPFIGEDGSIVALVIFRDITARKAMERAVRESEGRFRAISGAIPLPVVISDAATTALLYINPEACTQLAIDGDFLDRVTLFDLCPDSRFRHGVSEIARGRARVESCELEVRRPNGTRFWARITTVPMKYQGVDALIHAVVDLSERVQAEVEIARQREAFHQKEKIAALGSLLAGLAHELNNPLSVVSGQSLMLEDAADDEGIVRRARRIRDAAERCSRTVRTFLAMARSRAPARVAIALNDSVGSALDLVSHSLQSSGVAVQLDLDPALPPVTADADQLHHVVSNLVVNAEHALRETEPPRTLTVATRADGEAWQVVLTVADNGPGVPADIAERVFEPFFTTKAGASGTGIGLSLCRDIVTTHGGTIELSANEPSGAVFTVRLPMRDAQDERPAAVTGDGMGQQTGMVLVVDDDEEVALTLADVLRMRGHEVDAVFGGGDGIDQARRKPYDMIISDVRMPRVDGPSLYRALRQEIQDLDRRMVFMTGDTLGTDLAALVKGTGIPVIEKPLDPLAVATLVGERMHANRNGG